MTVGKDTIFERFLSPLFNTFLLDKNEMERFSQSIDWEREVNRYSQPNLVYPDYYANQNFHGIQGGYLTKSAAVTYDPITQYVLPPGETIVRQGLMDHIQVKPRRILDIGCGTGSMTIMLKQSFPESQVIGLDLSPYMLTVAAHKSAKANVDIQWQHGNAEKTSFPDSSFDLITAALLCHETPPTITQSILTECFRLLKVGGQILVLDGNQKSLRHTEWLTNIFEEPYIKSYAAGSVDAWMGAAGFGAVKTDDLWLIHQVTQGIKPIIGQNYQPSDPREIDLNIDDSFIPIPL